MLRYLPLFILLPATLFSPRQRTGWLPGSLPTPGDYEDALHNPNELSPCKTRPRFLRETSQSHYGGCIQAFTFAKATFNNDGRNRKYQNAVLDSMRHLSSHRIPGSRRREIRMKTPRVFYSEFAAPVADRILIHEPTACTGSFPYLNAAFP